MQVQVFDIGEFLLGRWHFEIEDFTSLCQPVVFLDFTNGKDMNQVLIVCYPFCLHMIVCKVFKAHNKFLRGVIKYFGAIELFSGQLDDLVCLVEGVSHDAYFLVDCELVDEKVLSVVTRVVCVDLELHHVGGNFAEEVGIEQSLFEKALDLEALLFFEGGSFFFVMFCLLDLEEPYFILTINNEHVASNNGNDGHNVLDGEGRIANYCPFRNLHKVQEPLVIGCDAF